MVRILDGALEAFVDVGIKRTSMNDVARRSRISPATLYRKFASKSGLIEAVGLREAHRILTEIDELMDELRESGADLETQATELFLAVMSQMRDHALFRRLMRTEPELVLPFFTTEGEQVLALGREYLAGLIKRFQADGLLPEYDPAPIAEVHARLALSLALTRPSVMPLDNRKKARVFVRQFLLPSLRAGAPS
jgi:AcrR family transcriptional regulator